MVGRNSSNASAGDVDLLWNMGDPKAVDAAFGTFARAMYASFNMMIGALDAELLEAAYSPVLAYTNFFYYMTTYVVHDYIRPYAHVVIQAPCLVSRDTE